VDITDKTDPKEISSLTLSGLFYDLYVDNEYAYIAQGAQGLTIVDIFYPENPQLSLAYNEIVDIQGLAKLGNYLFVGAGEYMYILNIVNAYDPTIVSKYTRLDADYTDIYVTSTYAFVVSLTEGYDVIRHTDKNNPEKVGHYFTSALPNSIYVEGDYVYLYDDLEGLLVIKSNNVAHPRKVASYSPEHSVYTFLVRGGYIYMAGSTSGLRILRTNPLLTLTGKIPLDSTVIILGLIFISALGVLFRKKRK
jgi:LPXTG-motif cell wall-anchored protein